MKAGKGKDYSSPLDPLEEIQSCNTLISAQWHYVWNSGLQNSKRRNVVLRYQIGGDLLKQPQEPSALSAEAHQTTDGMVKMANKKN